MSARFIVRNQQTLKNLGRVVNVSNRSQHNIAFLKSCKHSLLSHTRAVSQVDFHNSLKYQLSSARYAISTPINTVIMFIPQQEAWIVERMGKFYRILEPGINVLIPIVDKVKYVQSLKELAIDIPKQSAITLDNVTLNIDGVLYLRVIDPYKASYGVEDPEFAITQLAKATMRSELGKITLDSVFRERESLNVAIVDAINKASGAWGIDCKRYEIMDIRLPARVNEAMQMQVEAERKKRAMVLESEGIREADISVAEGKKRAKILASEAERTEKINRAQGDASAVLAKAEAQAKSLNIVAASLQKEFGRNAASLLVAEQYVAAFSNLAKKGNTLILPSNTSDIPNIVAQAMSIYSTLSSKHPPSINSALDEIQDNDSDSSKDWAEYISDKEEEEKYSSKSVTNASKKSKSKNNGKTI